MNRWIAICSALILLGAGCIQSSEGTGATVTFGASSSEGFVAFNEGFGKIPGPIPRAPIRDQFPIVEWMADLPTQPTEVTVLRTRQTLPEASFLQNITSAFRIPAGVLRSTPIAEALTIQWKDDDGYHWSYDAGEHRLTFERIGPGNALTVSTLPTNDEMISLAERFLTERGVDRRAWNDPKLAFSWNDWWLDVRRDHRCMSSASVAAIRDLAQEGSLDRPAPPALPFETSANCAQPEFPSLHTIRYDLNQDEQEVFDLNGERVAAAEVVVDLSTNTVRSGRIDMVRDVDRSNYPVLSLKETIEELRHGGLNGNTYGAGDVITITSFDRGLYRHDAETDGISRTYFIPGISANGNVARADGTGASFQTFVPLLREDAYLE